MRIVINTQVMLTPPPFPLFEMGEVGGGRTPQDKERVKRVPERASGIIKIESTDRAIDRLVSPTGTSPHKGTSCELSHKGMIYGLMDEEVRIVEGT